MSKKDRDFIGFSFNGVHSDKLGIVRVSDGDRYNEIMLPELEDLTIDIPGNNGQYYFGSNFKQRNFNIHVAFDSLTEYQFMKLKKLFSTPILSPLIFDEVPYKTYYVKIASPPEFNVVCFDEDLTEGEIYDTIERKVKHPVLFQPSWQFILTTDKELDGQRTGDKIYRYNPTYKSVKKKTRRIYKGEGTIDLVAYSPYGRCAGGMKDISYYDTDDYLNKDDWNYGAKLKKLKNLGSVPDYDTYIIDNVNKGRFKIYNPGHEKAEPLIYVPYQSGIINSLNIFLSGYGTDSMKIGKITRKSSPEVGVLINSHNHLIEGVASISNNEFITSGNIYNECITGGDFIKIPLAIEEENEVFLDNEITLTGTGITGADNKVPLIEYDYLYY